MNHVSPSACSSRPPGRSTTLRRPARERRRFRALFTTAGPVVIDDEATSPMEDVLSVALFTTAGPVVIDDEATSPMEDVLSVALFTTAGRVVIDDEAAGP